MKFVADESVDRQIVARLRQAGRVVLRCFHGIMASFRCLFPPLKRELLQNNNYYYVTSLRFKKNLWEKEKENPARFFRGRVAFLLKERNIPSGGSQILLFD